MKKLKNLFILFFMLGLLVSCASDDEYDPVMSEEDAKEIVNDVDVKDKVYFGFNKYNLSSEAKEVLDIQSAWLLANPDINVVIEGRCDERGTREYNLALGERRANSVKSYLIKKGINAKRIKTISYGKEKPIVFGSNEDAWSKNRVATTVQEIE